MPKFFGDIGLRKDLDADITGDFDFSGGGLVLPHGTSLPAQDEARVYFHETDDFTYYWDDTRSAWLSLQVSTLHCIWHRDTSSAQYLALTDVACGAGTSSWGYFAPHDGCVVAGSALMKDGSVEPMGFEFRAGGTTIDTMTLASGHTSFIDTSLSGLFTASDPLNCYSAQDLPAAIQATFWIKWRRY